MLASRINPAVVKGPILAWPTLIPRRAKAKSCVPAGRRIYAVGDIHGRADVLSSLLAQIDVDLVARPNADTVQVFIGDYIDRGPQSRQVLDLLIDRRRKHQTVFLKGNHELYAAAVLSDPSVLRKWLYMGATQTLLSYGVRSPDRSDPSLEEAAVAAFRQALPEAHRLFLSSLALSFSCGDYFFVHAGVRPGISLQLQSQQDLMWIRDEFLLHKRDFGKVIVHGHSPVAEPVVLPNRINIDTGAYATGRLTCLMLEGEQIGFL
jgi:Calcineurin-like phosphoesterase